MMKRRFYFWLGTIVGLAVLFGFARHFSLFSVANPNRVESGQKTFQDAKFGARQGGEEVRHPRHLTVSSMISRQSSATAAADFISILRAQSPKHEGVSIRFYEIRDLDRDGSFEVLEHVSAYEHAEGFLNIEIEEAFDWINVYREENGKFVEATKNFSGFTQKRKSHYALWLRIFEHPHVLARDSQGLVEANKTQFKRVLSDYLYRLHRLSQ